MAGKDGREPAPTQLQPSPAGKDDSELAEIQQIKSSRDELIDLAGTLISKYTYVPPPTAKYSLSIWMEQFGLENDVTPKCLLVNTLFPALCDEINKLTVLFLNPPELAENTLSKLKKTLDVFHAIDDILGQILDIAPIVWDPVFVDGSDKKSEKATEYRRERTIVDIGSLEWKISSMIELCLELLYLIRLPKCQQSTGALRRLEELTREAADFCWGIDKELTRRAAVCRWNMDRIVEFLGQSLFNVFLNHWQRQVKDLEDSTRSFCRSYYWDDQSIRDKFRHIREKRSALCLPFFKLYRLFLSKISKTTNHELSLFARMTPCQLLSFDPTIHFLDREVAEIVMGLKQRRGPQRFYKSLIKMIAASSQSLQFIYNFLDDLLVAPISDAELQTIRTTRDWYELWDQQLLISLRNVATFVGCGFPEPEEWSRVRFPEWSRARSPKLEF